MSSIDILKPIDDLAGYLRNGDNDDLFVVNHSDLGIGKSRTEVIFNIKSEQVTVKNTFVPQDIGRRVESLRDFLRSDSFMALIHSGYLLPVTSESAYAYMKTTEGKDEYMRVFGNTNNLDVDTKNVTFEDTRSDRTSANPKVVSIMKNPTMEDRSRLSALKNIQSELKQLDIAYIMQNTQNSDIKKWVQNVRLTGPE